MANDNSDVLELLSPELAAERKAARERMDKMLAEILVLPLEERRREMLRRFPKCREKLGRERA